MPAPFRISSQFDSENIEIFRTVTYLLRKLKLTGSYATPPVLFKSVTSPIAINKDTSSY